jgi:hypothetical protein
MKLRVDTGVSDAKNMMCGYGVVEAGSHEAAAQLFLDHPHFSIFPGQSVEIMQCLPLPKDASAQERRTAKPRAARPRYGARSTPT